MRVSSLTTSAGVSVPLGGFTVLVGPNNVGKSQTLRDIFHFFSNGQEKSGVILSGLSPVAPASREDLLGSLRVVPHPTAVEHSVARGIGATLRSADETMFQEPWLIAELAKGVMTDPLLNAFGKFHVAHLDAGSRLAVAASSESFNPHLSTPSTLLQGLYDAGEKTEKEFRDAFKQTFGLDVRLDFSGLTQLSLRVAREFPDIPKDPRDAFPVMSKFKLLDSQGDGFRSFAGVALSILLARKRVILLDEPEAFLHPAQARQLGTWIAKHATTAGSQVIVATHNAHFLSGILSAATPVDVIRLQRQDDATTFHHIPAEYITALASSPLLSSQGVLEALFHAGAVVCEGDPDRVIYHTVAHRTLGQRNHLFLHSQGKQTVKDVCQLLRNASTPTAAIVDIDILNDAATFRSLAESLGATEDKLAEWEQKRATLAAEVDGVPEDQVLSAVTDSVGTLHTELKSGSHTLAGSRSALQRIRNDASKWRRVKHSGIAAFSEQGQVLARELLKDCQSVGLMIVPVGELEGWIDVGTRQKKKWVPLALNVLWNSDGPKPLKDFISSALAPIGVVTDTNSLQT